ncbi:NEL-type E3 ubiquitin ligase domain-containing protein, partial [Pseudomonas sp.]|uniref:NEL-type E3 ubiquitin ligase domain-containing protein n=1 Tax=Pseudomonas sp. TaxID=306 RepID=UPI003CC61824
SEKVKLHSVETLPGWSPDVNISVRDGHFSGAELDSSGPEQAPIRKVLIKDGPGYETRDKDNRHLHGKDDLYGSILHALPDPQRAQLGFAHTSQKNELLITVRDLPLLPRHKVEALLQTRPLEPGERSPMGLAEGRPGQPLTTTGRVILDDSLLDKLRLLELEAAFQADARLLLDWLTESGLSRETIDARLNQLLGEQQALQASLDQWALSASALPEPDAATQASRQRIGEALWQHWRANSLPELGHRNVPLHLNGVALQDFPEQLPDFIYSRVQSLELIDFSPRSPHLLTNRPLMDLVAESTAQVETLQQFFHRFAQVTELRLTGNRALPFNARQPWAQLIRQHFPNLTSLSVVDMSMLIHAPEMADLRTLSQLRRLDLSGNFLSGSPDFTGLELDYLGLDRTLHGFHPTTTPLFDDSLLDHVSHISLRDNRLTQLPHHVLANGPATGHTTHIDLSNNPLPRATTVEAVWSERLDSRYRFTVEMEPSELQTLIRQRDELLRALNDWHQASGSSTAANGEREAVRRQTEQSLLNYWRSTCISASAPTLDLEGDISDFPLTLPNFFYDRVDRLALSRPVGSPAQLDRLLRRFQRLESLILYGHATPLSHLPAAIGDMPYLRYLDLTDQGLIIDQALLDDLARIPTLRGLALENNRVGTVTNASVLRSTDLNSLSLENTGLSSWPSWLDDLLPRPLQSLNLEDNQLVSVPDYLPANARSNDHVTHINLRGNPLPEELMRSLQISESYSSSYTFDTDLAEHEDALSSLGDSDTSVRSHSPHGGRSPQVSATVEPWLSSGDVEQLAARRHVWERLEAQGTHSDLLNLIDHLQGAADYRTATSRALLTERVWAVLEAADQDPALSELLNATAQAPLQQLHNQETCPDGMRLAFNQMEIQVFTQRAIRESPGLDRGQQLQRLVQRLFRLEELDRLAIQASGSRDEAEVRLVYRLRLAETLDLPLQPSRMLYETVANVSRKELDTALAQVQEGEHGQAFLRYAAQQDFWASYLRESHAERFKALKDDYEASVLALEDRYPGETQEQLGVRIMALEQQWQESELDLLMELTRMEQHSGGTA